MRGRSSAGRPLPSAARGRAVVRGTGSLPPYHPWLHPRVLLLPVILLALALYLHGLEAKSLWYDELGTLTCAGWGSTWADALRRSLLIPGIPKPPLYFLLTRLFLVLGDRVLFLRLPAVAWATLTIPLVYVLGSRLLDRWTGLLAALLLALAPFYVRYGQEARMYTMLTFLALLSLYLFLRAVHAGKWAWWLAFALVSAANLYVHLFALLPLGVIGLYAAWLLLRHRASARSGALGAGRAWRAGVALAIVLLLFAPIIPYLLQGLRSEGGLGGAVVPNWTAAMVLDTLRLWSGGNDVGLAVYLLLFALAVAYLAARRRGLLVAALLWLLPVALVLCLPFGQTPRARYFVFALPVYLALVACGLHLAIRWLANRVRLRAIPEVRALFAVALLLAPMMAVSGSSLAALYAEDKQNWRDAVRLVVDEARPGDLVYVRNEYHQLGFLFYAGQWPGQAGLWTKDNVRLLPGDPAQAFHLADQAGYWLIVPDRSTFLPGGELEDRLRPYFQLLPPVEFAPVRVPREAEVLGPTAYRTVLAVHVVASAAPSIRFWADDPLLPAGTCTWLRWQVDNVREVYLDGEGVPGHDGRQVCPAGTASYELHVTHLDGSQSSATVQIEVRP